MLYYTTNKDILHPAILDLCYTLQQAKLFHIRLYWIYAVLYNKQSYFTFSYIVFMLYYTTSKAILHSAILYLCCTIQQAKLFYIRPYCIYAVLYNKQSYFTFGHIVFMLYYTTSKAILHSAILYLCCTIQQAKLFYIRPYCIYAVLYNKQSYFTFGHIVFMLYFTTSKAILHSAILD